MLQKSDVRFRAEKEYKNSREKFFLLLREIISNAIHAVLIRKDHEPNFKPIIKLFVTYNNDECKIELLDNGEGFTKNNRSCFEELDKINREKEQHNFHPLGQGRLAIVYFSDSATFETIYKNEQGEYKKRIFSYPAPTTTPALFDLDTISENDSTTKESYTKLNISISSQQTLGRAKTFFKSHPDLSSFKSWATETFFPFLISNDDLTFEITYNGANTCIKKNNIEKECKTRPFKQNISGLDYEFKLWLLGKGIQMHGDNPITCFARDLKAELSNGRLIYNIDNDNGHLLYLTSLYFDENVDNKGEKIEISANEISEINHKIDNELDKEFASVIKNNKQKTQLNLSKFNKRFPSLNPFIEVNKMTDRKSIIKEADIIQAAIEEKSRIERKFWTNVDNKDNTYNESEECQKLLNSSLQIYVKHRETVLRCLHDLILKYTDEGEAKFEPENKIHDLFLKRGVTLNDSTNINHLHNLWILDDKYTTFSNSFHAKSTKQGQALSDIYLWSDDPEQTRQVLILELKSTTKAHNAGSHTESMIAQVKRYARDFYKNPESILNRNVQTDKILYTAIILARRTDINKELSSPSVSGSYNSVPFLDNSYYLEEKFSFDENPRHKMDIRIELYSFEDIYSLASARNEVFFKLLKQEFEISSEDINNEEITN